MPIPSWSPNGGMIDPATEHPLDLDWVPELDPDDLRDLQAAEQDPSKIVVKLPKEDARMGYFSVLCLIFNRMIGRSPTPTPPLN